MTAIISRQVKGKIFAFVDFDVHFLGVNLSCYDNFIISSFIVLELHFEMDFVSGILDSNRDIPILEQNKINH